MALQTLIALVFAFTSTRTSVSDPEKGPGALSETSNGNRNSSTRVDNNEGDDADEGEGEGEGRNLVQEAHLDIDVDDDEDGSPPNESDLGPPTDPLQLPDSPEERPSLLARAKTFMFPPSSDVLCFVPNYRCTPLISGIVIPFSILLEIPGLTGYWYIRTEDYDTIQTRPNPALLDTGLAFSMTCAVIANKWVMATTILCIIFLSIHDIINIVALTIFGVSHRFDDGFTYGEAFWITVCSTVASVITNVSLIIDFIRTPDFKTSGSGLTRKQRTLVIILIILFTYIALGSMINSFMLSLSFINGLYFTVTSIETIGFGDIVPTSPGSRVFICFYAFFGIVNLAVVVGMVGETVREGLHVGYLRRLQEIRERRRASRRRKNAERRWRSAVIWKLRDKGAKVWVRKHRSKQSDSLWAKVKRRFFNAAERIPRPLDYSRGMRLNLEALTHDQLEAAAMEAGVPLDALLPPEFYEAQMQNDDDSNADDLEMIASKYMSVPHPVYGINVRHGTLRPLTHQRVGAMAALLTRFAIEFSGQSGPQAAMDGVKRPSEDSASNARRGLSIGGAGGGGHNVESSATLATTSSSDDINTEYDSKNALWVRSSFSWALFVVFWMVGAAIFSKTEGWSYGSSIYFCFVAFTTIGYGDLAPRTPAGRSVFVVWALLGVATVTVLISVASEAYSERYKGMLQSDSFERAVTLYRMFSEQEDEGGEGSKQPQDTEMNAPDPNLRAQDLLETLPRHVLNETRSFQEYMRYLGNNGKGTNAYVNERLKALLDDVLGAGGMKESVKMNLLRDKGTRQMLVTLSIESESPFIQVVRRLSIDC
ncbi:uncharacterized protein EDB91DRAFT_1237119 [Suillus paluster]|uniref:uncharacterized protein n=1 Tax=Suillus paluster TaxID=48578 RepID=UPI001B86E237|nr:uncharacterized protein EDB91DRAFT_1237119 [Suillus paluster]KAG1741433.1 hypothetical protein EDB91DRAFT_1237119 [Suillus paluster]